MSDKSFEDIAEEQGWTTDTQLGVLMEFVDNYADKAKLIAFAQSVADEENGAES